MNGPYEWREAPRAEFAVIGDPIAHSLSPKMMAAAFSAMGLPYRYVAIHVPQGEAAEALDRLASLGYRGVNATVPLKNEAFRWLDVPDAFSVRVQASNTIDLKTKHGINTDGLGFLDTLSDLDIAPPGVAVVLGAGGSARAVCLAVVEAGFSLRLWNRTRARAEELVDSLRIQAEILDAPVPDDADVIVNATSAGLSGVGLSIDWSRARKEAVAYDLMYGKGQEFTAGALTSGLRAAVDGIPLLAAQGARSLEWWLGMSAPREAMLGALR